MAARDKSGTDKKVQRKNPPRRAKEICMRLCNAILTGNKIKPKEPDYEAAAKLYMPPKELSLNISKLETIFEESEDNENPRRTFGRFKSLRQIVVTDDEYNNWSKSIRRQNKVFQKFGWRAEYKKISQETFMNKLSEIEDTSGDSEEEE